jgi:hypothetical protein
MKKNIQGLASGIVALKLPIFSGGFVGKKGKRRSGCALLVPLAVFGK